MLDQVTHAIRGGQYTAPKTILGFLGVVYLLFVSFCLGVIVALASSGTQVWLIPVVLLVVVLTSGGLVWAVLRLAERDPTPLVLGEMTGGDYIAHRKMTMGDSASGEQVTLDPQTAIMQLEAAADPDDGDKPAEAGS